MLVTYRDLRGAEQVITTQEIYDRTVTHMADQGGPANEDGVASCECTYRIQRDGKVLRCAVGYWIPDRLYDPRMEHFELRLDGKGEGHLLLLGALEEALNIRTNEERLQAIGLLTDLQGVHDFSNSDGMVWKHEGPSAIRNTLSEVADKWRLNTLVLDEKFPESEP